MTITNRVSLKSVEFGITPIDDVPDAPTIGAATNVGTSRAFNNGSATVAYTANPRGGPVTTFTATSTPGGFTATGASPITVTGLQSATSYTFTVSAANANGTQTSAATSSITATTVPQAPTVGTATNATGQSYTGSASISVPFTANATGGSSITGYTVTSSSGATGSGSSSPISVSETVGNPTSTARTYTVTATNANGTSTASSASNSIAAVSVPQAPTIGTATDGGTGSTATVTYTANATGGAAVSTFTATSSPGGFTGTGASPITISGLTAGTAYTFSVTATNASGTSAASAASNSITPAVPKAGFFSDGAYGSTSNVDKISFTSETRSTLTALLGAQQQSGVAFSNNSVAAYFTNVNFNPKRTYKLAYATDTASNLGVAFSNASNATAVANSGTAGYIAAGNGAETTINKLAFSNDAGSTIAATLANGSNERMGFGRNGSTAGYFAGGSTGGFNTAIAKLTFSNESRSNLATGLSAGWYAGNGSTSNSGTAAYMFKGPGSTETFSSAIIKFVFSGETNSTIATTLSAARYDGSAMGHTGSAGYSAGGYIPAGNATVATIDRIAFSNDARTTLGATLTTARFAHSGTENTN